MKKKETGNGLPLSRRAWFGALAGVAALVAGRRQKRTETVAEKRQKRRFWIGHT